MHRKNGRPYHQNSRLPTQHLTSEKKKVLVDVMEHMCEWLMTPTYTHIVKLAQEIISGRGDDSSTHIGKYWASRFLARFPRLQMALSTRLQGARTNTHDPEAIHDFYQKIFKFFDDHRIKLQTLYNIDEKGFLLGMNAKKKVVVRYDFKRTDRMRREYNNRELSTLIEYISANGTHIRGMAILKSSEATARAATLQAHIDNNK